jgi:protein-L-isoaspartate(D-aspartate) O-methyltransferase
MLTKASVESVARAVRAVRREEFLPGAQRSHADEDRPLPIGYEQTISQPSLVVEMTGQLELTPQSRVLEIGTGSGYQTAILAEIAAAVFTVERVPELAQTARARLDRLGYRNIQFRLGDGALGWPEAAPFDAVIVTAAAPALPPALVAQLAPGGRMVVPVGVELENQVLLLLVKDATGHVQSQELFGVRFVPLVSSAGSGAPPSSPGGS